MLIHEKMIAIMSDVPVIGKNESNKQQNFKFRGIDIIYNELHGLMVKHGVFTTSKILSDRHEDRITKSGSNLIYRVIVIEYTFTCADGSSVQTTVIGEGMDTADKASNKAMSVAHKYALLQAFMIPTDEEKDPDYQSHEDSSGLDNEIIKLIENKYRGEVPKGAESWQSFTVSRKIDLLNYLKGIKK